MVRGDFSTARSKLPARLISTRHPILRITTLSARCESLLSREPFTWMFCLNFYPCAEFCTLTVDQIPPMRFPTQKPYRKTLERRYNEEAKSLKNQENYGRTTRDEIALRRSRKKKNRSKNENEVCSRCALLFRYNWKDRAENKGQGQFMAALPSGVGGWLAAATAQHQRRSRESHYARPAK
ncbi:hypothetical protein ALC62_07972 [Cyphomyrmex costatus]|uniref:Uncharacterized protein n=1 Tax=Cyphomyrmex costatus TaxID=456900 RepID=A0A195CKW9_9HYME|nr:hypothetical protein ALC62_07972 [Cyphomyrmex costatus]